MNLDTFNQTLDLPPGFQAVPLREYRDAFSHALSIAAAEGAGSLVWVRRFDSVEVAVVLEPEQSLGEARCAIYAGMNAAADALGLYCPPEKPIEFAWPDTIMLDGGIIGGCRLGWPPDAAEQDVPDWLVLGMCIRSTVQMPVTQTFDRGTSLEAEGFEMMDGKLIIESFCRHLMAAFDGWRAKGFKTMAERYLARMPQPPAALSPSAAQPKAASAPNALRRGLDGNGDLLLRSLTKPHEIDRQPLTLALGVPQWLDPETGAPWL
jgi:biotin-(acetyl-CoA carboxylase) ligase